MLKIPLFVGQVSQREQNWHMHGYINSIYGWFKELNFPHLGRRRKSPKSWDREPKVVQHWLLLVAGSFRRSTKSSCTTIPRTSALKVIKRPKDLISALYTRENLVESSDEPLRRW